MPEGTGNGEKGLEDGPETPAMGEEGARCPICLGSLAQRDLGVPSSCYHLFCLHCILRWAEMVPSCPVDRRPFSIIYRCDPVLGFVRIPVKTGNSEMDLQICHCKNGAKKEDRDLRSKIEKLAQTSPVRMKDDIQRKCNTGNCKHKQGSLAVERKKLNWEPCSPWALDLYPAPTVLDSGLSVDPTHELTQLMAWYEQQPSRLHKHCRLEVQEQNQWPAMAAVIASHLSWQSLGAHEVNGGVCPLGSLLPRSAALPLRVARWFACQGRACALTYTKGEQKKNTRAAGSKGPKGKTETMPTRSTRNRTQELPPSQEPCSSQSAHSDSSSSFPNQSPTGSGESQPNRKPTGKRKSGQVAKQEECVKRNTRSRRRALEESVSSPEECVDEEQQSLCDQEEGEESKTDEESDSQVSNCEQSPSAHSDASAQGSEENLCPDTSNHSSGYGDPKDVAGDALTISDDDIKNDSSQGDKETVFEAPERDKMASLHVLSHDVEQKNTDLQSNTDHALALDGDQPVCNKGQEMASPESCCSQGEVKMDILHNNAVSISDNQLADAKMQVDQDVVANKDAAAADTVKPMETSEGSMELGSTDHLSEGFNNCQVVKMAEGVHAEVQGSEASPKVVDAMIEEASKEPCEDNMEMVPMDCDSPNNSHCESQSELDKGCGGVDVGTDVSSQTSDEGKKPLQGSQEVTVEQKGQTAGRQRKSRFHSPSTTWSPKKDSKQERDRSRSRSRENASSQRDPKGERRRSRSRSRGRDRSRDWERNGSWSSRHKSRDYSRERDNDKDGQKNEDYRRNRYRERNSRRRSRTRSRSNSRSRSLPRNRAYGRSSPSEHTEPGGRSPRRRDWWASDERRNTRDNYQSRRHDQEKTSNFYKEAESSNNGGVSDFPSPDQGRAETPDWVKEKMKGDSEDRGKSRGTNASQWEDSYSNGAGDSWTRGAAQGSWDTERRRGTGWNQRASQQKGESEQNRWQSRNTSSGTSNHSGSDSYSRFNENRLNRRPAEQEPPEHPVDRSGWSSASSWAVCRTLPADVQDYYSRRGRGSSAAGGGWNRHNEEKSAQETPQGEPNPQGSRGLQPPVNVLHHPQMNPPAQPPAQVVAPLLPFPIGAAPQPLKLPPAPFAVPHQVPLFLHPPVPLMQVPVAASQGLPPPPPPPPIQHVDGHSVQKAVSGSVALGLNRLAGPLSSSLPKAAGGVAQGAPSTSQPSSTTQPRPSDRHHADTHVDSSKKEKKLQIQEKAIHEVKAAIKPYYQNKDITKEEYKEIVRKAVEKVCHSKSGEVNSGKVANLVKAYVEKYKHDRKNKPEDTSK